MAIQTLFKLLILIVFGLYIIKYLLGAIGCVILVAMRNDPYNRFRMALGGVGPGLYIAGFAKAIINIVLLLLVGGLMWLAAERFITV